MVNVKITRPDVLKALMSGMQEFTRDIKFKFEDGHMKSSFMATGNFAAVFFDLYPSCVSIKGEDSVFLESKDFCSSVRFADEKNPLTFETESMKGRVIVNIGVKKRFELPIVQETDDYHIPSKEHIMTLPVLCELDVAVLKDAISTVLAITKETTIEFNIKDKMLRLSASSSNKKTVVDLQECAYPENIYMRCNSDFVLSFLRCGAGCDKVTLRFGHNTPLELEFTGKDVLMQDNFKAWIILGAIVDND